MRATGIAVTVVAAAAASASMGQWDAGPRASGPGSRQVGPAGEPSPVVDPFGDAVDVFGEGGPLLDIDTIDVRYDAEHLLVSMSFHTEISAPSAHRANSLVGAFEFDVDRDPATGEEPLQNEFAPPFAGLSAGIDFAASFFTEEDHPGFVEIHDTSFHLVSTVPIEFTSHGLSFAVPLDDLGSDGVVDFTTVIGTAHQPTDATNVVGRSVPVPTPGSLTLLALAGATAARRRR